MEVHPHVAKTFTFINWANKLSFKVHSIYPDLISVFCKNLNLLDLNLKCLVPFRFIRTNASAPFPSCCSSVQHPDSTLALKKGVPEPDFLYSLSEHIFSLFSCLMLIPRNERVSHSDKNMSRCFTHQYING